MQNLLNLLARINEDELKSYKKTKQPSKNVVKFINALGSYFKDKKNNVSVKQLMMQCAKQLPKESKFYQLNILYKLALLYEMHKENLLANVLLAFYQALEEKMCKAMACSSIKDIAADEELNKNSKLTDNIVLGDISVYDKNKNALFVHAEKTKLALEDIKKQCYLFIDEKLIDLTCLIGFYEQLEEKPSAFLKTIFQDNNDAGKHTIPASHLIARIKALIQFRQFCKEYYNAMSSEQKIFNEISGLLFAIDAELKQVRFIKASVKKNYKPEQLSTKH